MYDDMTDAELLTELTTMPHWGSLVKEIRRIQEGLKAEMLRPSADLHGLTQKEAASRAFATLDRLIDGVEANVERAHRSRFTQPRDLTQG